MGPKPRTHSTFPRVIALPTPGLGDHSYLFSHKGESILIDPQRDIDRFLRAAEQAETRIMWVAETHVHNDYVSGARAAARQMGASLLLPAGAGAAFDHIPAFHQEDIEAGSFVIRPIHTPGHTPEHLSYLILVEDEPRALFTGGSLLVGSVGRTDLLDPAQTRHLARLQIGSVKRLAALPKQLGVYPTHGQGSLCTTGVGAGPSSTIGSELRTNRALAPKPVEELVDGLLAGFEPYPAYYQHMARINRLQASGFPRGCSPELRAEDLLKLGDVPVIDIRSRHRYVSGHIASSLNIELGDSFATWVGWLLPFNSQLVLVVDNKHDASEAILALSRIGFDQVVGVLHGLSRWNERLGSLASTLTVTSSELATAIRSRQATQVLDVRSPTEWNERDLPGSIHIYLPDLADRALDELDRYQPVWVACATGYRAALASGILERLGFEVTVTIHGGIQDLRGLQVRSTSTGRV